VVAAPCVHGRAHLECRLHRHFVRVARDGGSGLVAEGQRELGRGVVRRLAHYRLHLRARVRTPEATRVQHTHTDTRARTVAQPFTHMHTHKTKHRRTDRQTEERTFVCRVGSD
jgi:hypothetical protein